MLGGVDHGRPGQLCCYSSLHIFLKVCVDFKDSFNPLARIGNTLWHCVNNLHGTLGATNKRWSLKAKCRHAYLCPLCSFSSFHRRRSFWWRSTSESQISSCKTSPWGLDSAVGEKYLLLKNLFMRCRCYTHSARKKNPLTFKHKWQPHITVITTLQAGIKINICYLKKVEKRK